MGSYGNQMGSYRIQLGLNNSIPMDWVGIGNIEVFQLSPVGSFQEFNPNGLDWDWIGLGEWIGIEQFNPNGLGWDW